MEEAEIHHDRPPLAGVVRELESLPPIDGFHVSSHPGRAKRLRQAVGVAVRIIMERRGWTKTGKKGSLGSSAPSWPAARPPPAPYHNTGGLAFWFLRAERYARPEGMPFLSVRDRAKKLKAPGTTTIFQQQTQTKNVTARRCGCPCGGTQAHH